MILKVSLGKSSYDVVIEEGALKKAGELLNLNRKVLVVTDSGVPKEYAKTVQNASYKGYLMTLPQGEENKNFDNYRLILERLVTDGFTRTDCVVAVGGGVVGDMAGFAAATFMRGIDFYNIPTTVLAQMDSSIGGKTAIDFCGYKNIVGAFFQPKKVIVDPLLIKTQDKRQIVSGLAESVKMAATFDEELFELFENTEDPLRVYRKIAEKSLTIKKNVVEQDEKESGLRKVLNFGHTIGHAIEKCCGLGTLYHGECVALGMMYTSSGEAKARIESVLKKLGLKTTYPIDREAVMEAIKHDKKASGDIVSVVLTDEIGTYKIEKLSLPDIYKLLDIE